jgi:hypothetical protein
MEIIRAEYTACGGMVAMPLLRDPSGGGGSVPSGSRAGARTGGKPVRVSLDW